MATLEEQGSVVGVQLFREARGAAEGCLTTIGKVIPVDIAKGGIERIKIVANGERDVGTLVFEGAIGGRGAEAGEVAASVNANGGEAIGDGLADVRELGNGEIELRGHGRHAMDVAGSVAER